MNKLPVLITTDSVCDLPGQLTEQYHILVNPYYVVTEQGRFRDEIEVGSEDLVSYIRAGNFAKSQSPKVEEYEAFFASCVDQAETIIHIAMGRYASMGYDNATAAAAKFSNVRVFHSKHLSSSLGLIALYAAELAERMMDADTIIEKLEAYTDKVSSAFLLFDLEYMYRAKRLSRFVRNLSYRLLFRPVLYMKQGRIAVKKVMFGRWQPVVRKYVNYLLKHPRNIDTRRVFVTHVALEPDMLDMIKKEILRRVNFESIIFVDASAAISCNCGSGTVGVLFARKSEENGLQPQSNEPMAMLQRMDFLDWRTGMVYVADNAELYIEILQEYLADDKAVLLKTYLDEQNWNDYRVTVHALKSSSKTIGLNELSEEARLLEFACKDGDYAYVCDHHEEVMEHYHSYCRKIEAVIGRESV